MTSVLSSPVVPLRQSGLPSSPLSEPTEVDYVLALLQSKQSHDRLSLAINPQIRTLLLAYAIDDQRQRESHARTQSTLYSQPLSHQHLSTQSLDYLSQATPEQPLFSDALTKLNRRHKAQQRVLLVTDRALYNFEVGQYKKCKRRIVLKRVEGVTVSDDGDDFVIHVKDEYDYHYRTSRRADVLHILARQFKALMGRQLPIAVTHQQHLPSFTLTKQRQLQQQQHVTDAHSTPSNHLIHHPRPGQQEEDPLPVERLRPRPHVHHSAHHRDGLSIGRHGAGVPQPVQRRVPAAADTALDSLQRLTISALRETTTVHSSISASIASRSTTTMRRLSRPYWPSVSMLAAGWQRMWTMWWRSTARLARVERV